MNAGLLAVTVLCVAVAVWLFVALRRTRRQIGTREALALEAERSVELYRTTVDALIDGVVVQDDQGRIEQVNESARHMLADYFGVTNELEGSVFADVVPELVNVDGRPLRRGDRSVLHVLESGVPVVDVVLGFVGDDETRWFRCNAMATRPDRDGHQRVVVTFADATADVAAEHAQQAALERERQAVAKLVQLDETRSTFVSTVSHELRTPLTSLIGYLELLDDEVHDGLGEAHRRMLGAAVRNGVRLSRLIDDLLTLTAAETDLVGHRDDIVPISELLDDVLEAVSPLAAARELALRVDVHPSAGAVRGDRAELERVLLNIAGNAIKFTPSGGAVMIEARQSGGAEPEMVIEVADTGVGIPEDELDQVFTRFFRSRTAGTHDVPGTGLGLVIATNLVEAHGGQIELRSVVGEGTTVSVTLPALVG